MGYHRSVSAFNPDKVQEQKESVHIIECRRSEKEVG